MNEKQLNALANTIQLYNAGQLDLTDSQLRDLKQIADTVGIPFSPDFSADRAALGLVNQLAFGIPGAIAKGFGSEAFEPITPGEEIAGSIGGLLSFLVGGGIAKKALGGIVTRGLASQKSRDLAVRAAAALRSTGLPGTRRAARSIAARGPFMQNIASSGLGYGAVGGLQGLFDPQGTLLGGFTEGAAFGALTPLGARLLARGKAAGNAAAPPSAAPAAPRSTPPATPPSAAPSARPQAPTPTAAERERALRVAEQLRRMQRTIPPAPPGNLVEISPGVYGFR